MLYVLRHKVSVNANPSIGLNRVVVNRANREMLPPISHWKIDPPQFNPQNEIFMPSLDRCEVIPDEEHWRIPDKVFQGPKRWKKLPDTMTPVAQWIVSEKFHDIVQKFDPEGHQFFPVEIIDEESGTPYGDQGQFYFWNVINYCPPWEIFDIEAMRANGHVKYEENNEGFFKIEKINSSIPYILISRDFFTDKHIFRTFPRKNKNDIYYSIYNYVILKNDIKTEMQNNKINSVDFLNLDILNIL